MSGKSINIIMISLIVIGGLFHGLSYVSASPINWSQDQRKELRAYYDSYNWLGMNRFYEKHRAKRKCYRFVKAEYYECLRDSKD